MASDINITVTFEYGYVRPKWKRGRRYLMTAERGWPGRGLVLYRIVAAYKLGASSTGARRYVVIGYAFTRGQAERAVWAARGIQRE